MNFKVEGKIIVDTNNRLKKLLDAHQPLANYDAYTERKKVTLKILDRTSNTYWLSCFQCGLAFSFLGYAFINKLANSQIYNFNIQSILKIIHLHIPEVTEAYVKMMLHLRLFRHSYKTRVALNENPDETLAQGKLLISKLFKVNFEAIDPRAPARLFKMPLASIKDFEARILAFLPPDELDNGELLPDIWKAVKFPQSIKWGEDGEVYDPHLDAMNLAV